MVRSSRRGDAYGLLIWKVISHDFKGGNHICIHRDNQSDIELVAISIANQITAQRHICLLFFAFTPLGFVLFAAKIFQVARGKFSHVAFNILRL